MPPTPKAESTSYGPKRVPPASVMADRFGIIEASSGHVQRKAGQATIDDGRSGPSNPTASYTVPGLLVGLRGGGKMAAPAWSISGQYCENCSCEFICPCIVGQMAARPSKGSCNFAMAMQIERGNYGDVPLDGISFVVLGYTPEEMGKGNWSVGLVVDERATAEQREAVTAIASGAAGGPMAPLSGLIGKFLGVERAPIRLDRNGVK